MPPLGICGGKVSTMLTLSKQTDYALLALTYLAAGRAANTKEIAEQYDIPLELLAKVLQRLTRAELLTSTAGPTGGYRLARPPETVTVGEVVKIVDGAPALAQCMRPESAVCGQQEKCTIRAPLAAINSRILALLDCISLAEIARDETQLAPLVNLSHVSEFSRRPGIETETKIESALAVL